MNIDLHLNREANEAEAFPARRTGRHRQSCPRCGGSLQEGFLIEHQSGFAPAAPTLWQSGPLGESYWTGVEAKPVEQRRVVAHRCERCGAIDLFAL
jgi:ribosomal protein S27AE